MEFNLKSKVLLGAGSGILLLLLSWVIMHPTESLSVGDDAKAEDSAAEMQEFTGEDAESVDEDSLFNALATLATPAEDNPVEAEALIKRSQTDTPVALTAEHLLSRKEIETQVETALSGDNNEAIELSRFLNQCQLVPQNKGQVERSIERAAQSFAEGKPMKQFRPGSLIQEFDSIESFELEQWASYYRCDAARGLIDDGFWERLEREADAGNPVARYLFATLKRGSENAFLGFDRWDEELELTEQSREYTWRNMQEREPLGLLAMAQTGRFGTQFTLGGASVNVVLSLAAVKCGLATPELLDQVDQMIEKLKRMEVTYPGALEQLNTASDEARRMFCQ